MWGHGFGLEAFPDTNYARNMRHYATTVAALRERVRAGLSLDESIVFLHDAGLPIVHSIRAIHEVFGLPLSEAKHVTAGHPVWAPMAEAARQLHDDLEYALRYWKV